MKEVSIVFLLNEVKEINKIKLGLLRSLNDKIRDFFTNKIAIIMQSLDEMATKKHY